MFTILTAGLMTLQAWVSPSRALGELVSPSTAILIAACCGLTVVGLLQLPPVTRESAPGSRCAPTATPEAAVR